MKVKKYSFVGSKWKSLTNKKVDFITNLAISLRPAFPCLVSIIGNVTNNHVVFRLISCLQAIQNSFAHHFPAVAKHSQGNSLAVMSSVPR